MKRAALILCALATLSLLSSCWRPIFDEQVSSSAYFYKKIGSPFRTIGAFSLYSDILDGEFVPERSIDPYNGFWLTRSSGSLALSFIAYSSGSGYAMASSSRGVGTSGGDLSFARSLYYTSPDPELLLGLSSGSTAMLDMETFDGSSAAFLSSSTTSLRPSATSIAALGATQVAGSDEDFGAVLFYNSDQLYASVFSLTESLGTPSTGTIVPLGSHTLASYGRVFPELSSGAVVGLYYCSGDGTILHWDWDSGSDAITSSAPSVLQVDEPLVAVLSDGTLVCQGTDYLSAYAADGSEIFHVLAGSVRFVHEVNSGTTCYCLFEQTIIVPSSGQSDDEVYVRLWRLPTSSFASLGD